MLLSRFPGRLMRFVRDESGTTAIEYALIASVISIAIIGSASGVRDALIDNFYNKVVGGLENAGTNGGNEDNGPD